MTQEPLFDLKAGVVDGLLAMQRALENAPDWAASARVAIAHLAEMGLEFTSEDVTRIVGLPETGSPNAVGAMMNAAARQGIIRRTGDTHARRRNQHGTRIGVWTGA